MNEKSTNTQDLKNGVSQSAFWGTIALSGIFMLLCAYFLTVLFKQPHTLVIYAGITIFLMAMVTSGATIVLTVRNRQSLASQALFFAVNGLGVTILGLFQGRAPTASITILAISAIMIRWLLPNQLRRSYSVAAATAFSMMWVVEWINPAWRIQLPAAQIGPVSVVVFMLIFGVIGLVQAREAIASSLRYQITLLTGAIIFVLSIIIITYSIVTARQTAINNAQTEALSVAEAHAGVVESQIEPALSAARTMAYTLESVKAPNNLSPLTRDQVNGMLRNVAEQNPAFLGTWTIWEPNAFDGRDAQYINAPLHDATGRFIPYWVRGNDKVEGVAVVDYETPKPGVNDWYFTPRDTKQETLITPYFYPINGVNIPMTTLAVPILTNNKFYGVAGVDLKIDFVQGILDDIDIYNGKATAVLLTDTGTLVAVGRQPEQALQPATDLFKDFDQIRSRVAAGDAFVSLSADGQYLRVFFPVDIGNVGTHWSLSLIIPFSEITAPATASALQQAVISLVVLLLALLALWYLTGRMVQPIRELTTVANSVSEGNLNAVANVNSRNETGILANAFNSMTAQLRGTLSTLEQRVADRTRNLELAAEVGRTVSQVRSLDVMLKDACDLILKEFNLYYVQVYLTDASGSVLKLESGTGTVGAQLVGRGHSLQLNTGSINGRAATEKRSVIISDTAQSATFRQNPLLPDTRGEMAVPLIVANKVVGVLDMQSNQPGILTEEILPAFEALAGQLAVAIQNANLLAETEQARAQIETQARRLVKQGWSEHLDAIHKPEQIGFVFDRDQVTPLADLEASQLSEDAQVVSAPIAVTGASLGSLVVELDNSVQHDQTSELVNIVARQVSQQIENLRLLESAERYRHEAEEASRRLTREGWKSYKEKAGASLKYIYDLNEVRLMSGNGSHVDETSVLTLPLKVRDEAIGKIAVSDMDANNQDAIDLINAVTERLGTHIESLRQNTETQLALAQSEKLFDASRNLTQSTDLQGLVKAAVESFSVHEIDRAVLGAITYGPTGETEGMTIVANWSDSGELQATPIGTQYTKEMLRSFSLFTSAEPLFFNDMLQDPRIDDVTLGIAKRANYRTLAALPLFIGPRQDGVLLLEGEQPHNFTQDEIRLLSALAPQISTVLENRRQFERAQQQANRESTLNVISQKIQSATTVEAVLQIAARELGHALGAPMTVAQLSMKDRS